MITTRGKRLLVIILLLVGGSAAIADQGRRHGNNAVIHWNRIATEILPIEVGPVIDSRAMAILHAAIHDAVNAIERRYEPYTADISLPGASLDAAVASAARDVMIATALGQRERVEQEYAAALARVPDGPAKDHGVIVGQKVARANLDRRADDGIVAGPWPPQEGPITEPVYVPTGKPGDYDFTPPFDAPPLGPVALFPGWGRLTPFAIDLARHRLRGPDPLRSFRYARDLNIVKSVGSLHSSVRTADQTEIACSSRSTRAFRGHERLSAGRDATLQELQARGTRIRMVAGLRWNPFRPRRRRRLQAGQEHWPRGNSNASSGSAISDGEPICRRFARD